jgi:hypothetical protein
VFNDDVRRNSGRRRYFETSNSGTGHAFDRSGLAERVACDMIVGDSNAGALNIDSAPDHPFIAKAIAGKERKGSGPSANGQSENDTSGVGRTDHMDR